MIRNSKLRGFGALMLGASLFFTSCGDNSPKTLTAIPNDAAFVMGIDPYSLAKKVEMDKVKDLSFYKLLEAEAKNEEKGIADLLSDPSNSGIDYLKDVFVYNSTDANGNMYICFTAGVKDEAKMVSFFQELIDKSNGNEEILEKEDYKTLGDSKAMLGWDKEKLVFVSRDGYSTEEELDAKVNELLHLESQNQIANHSEFNKFHKSKKDINFWMSYGEIMDMMPAQSKMLYNQFTGGTSLEGNYITSHLNFDDNDINLSYNFVMSDEVKAKLKEANIEGEFNPKLLNYFPEESYMSLSFSTNPMGYYELMKDQIPPTPIPVDIAEIISSFKGNMVASVFGFEEVIYQTRMWNGEMVDKNQMMPMFGVAIDLNKDETLKGFLQMVPPSLMAPKGEYYEIKQPGMPTFYFGMSEELIYFTNDEKTIENFPQGYQGGSTLADNKLISSEMKDNTGYMNLVLNLDEYPLNLQDMVYTYTSMFKGKEFLSVWNGFMRNIEGKQIDNEHSELSVHLTDKDGNSLYNIIETADECYQVFQTMQN